MIQALRLCLILTLMLTGIGLGAARGTVQSGGQIVLCTGEGIVTIAAPDAPGGQRTHICPDMALALLNATAAPAPQIVRAPVIRRFVHVVAIAAAHPVILPLASARDPPHPGMRA